MPQSELPKRENIGFNCDESGHYFDGFNDCHSQFSEAMVERLTFIINRFEKCGKGYIDNFYFDIKELINEIREVSNG